jgi:hypothetical protein
MPRYDSGAFVLSRLRVHLTPADGKQSEIDLAEVVTDYAEPKLPNGASGDPQGILGRVPGVWSIYPHVGQPHCLLVKANRPFGGPEHATLTVILAFAEPGPGHNLGRFRLAVTDSLQTLAAERWRLLLAGTTVNGWVRLGVAHCLREQWAEALAALNKGVSDSPSDGAWSLFQALAAGKLGHRDEAQRHQQRGLAALRRPGKA